MGYLPIIVALAGFIFLWGIVNFNSLKRKKKEAEEAASLLFKYAALRNTILRQMNQITEVDPTIHTIVEQIQSQLNDQTREEISVQEKTEKETEITSLIEKIPTAFVGEGSYDNTYRQLLVADNHYRKAATLYRIRLHQYNELVTRNPSKQIAKLTGFRPIETL